MLQARYYSLRVSKMIMETDNALNIRLLIENKRHFWIFLEFYWLYKYFSYVVLQTQTRTSNEPSLAAVYHETIKGVPGSIIT